MTDIQFDPEDQAPDEDFAITNRNARLAAEYHRTLIDNGVGEVAAIDLTREWIANAFRGLE